MKKYPSKQKRSITTILTKPIGIGLAAGTLLATSVHAADGTWNSDANGNWESGETAPWLSGTVAEGADFTADFSTIDLTAHRTITVTNPLTIGNIIFDDTSGTSQYFVGGSTLTLDTTSGTPTITTHTSARLNGIVAGNDGLVKEGTGTLEMRGANTYTGTTTINAGRLQLFTPTALNGDIVMGGGELWINSNVTISLSDNISGTGGQIVQGNGSSVLSLLGNNTASNNFLKLDGTLMVGTGTNNGIGSGTFEMRGGQTMTNDNSARTFNNALKIKGGIILGADQGASSGLGDLTFTDTNNVIIGSDTEITVNNDTTVTFNNSWGGGARTLTKSGAGNLVFNGDITSNLTSDLTINGGKLVLNGDQSAYLGETIVNNSATLGGSGDMGGSVILNDGGALAPGNSIGTFSGTDVTWNGGGEMQFELSNLDSSSDLLALSGALTKGTAGDFTFNFLGTGAADTTYTLATFSSTGLTSGDLSYTGLTDGLSGSFSVDGDSIEFVVIPEPSTFLLLCAGILAAFPCVRNRRK